MEAMGHEVRREPSNKGRIVGQKAPFKPKEIWALLARLQMEGAACANLRSSIWASTASCGAATSWRYQCGASATETRWPRAPSPCSTRPSARCSSISRLPPGTGGVAGVDQAVGTEVGGLPSPKPAPRPAPPGNLAVLPYHGALGRPAVLGPCRLRDALDATDPSDADLPVHQKPSRRPTAAPPPQARVDGEIPGHRGR